jgi:hypothetical protein
MPLAATLYRQHVGPQVDTCPIHFEPPPNNNVQLEINPIAGSAPLRLIPVRPSNG